MPVRGIPIGFRQRYLALPPGVPDRVRALAIELTAPERTPYDRARAIESYLRTFPYTLDVPRPPVGRDVVDYFLFDLKKGYCDYYASSMVVLARAAGIPARLVIGYANGTYNLNSKRFVVTEADAHSWVEVYFPGIGWVTFEPTSGRPPLNRADAALPLRHSPRLLLRPPQEGDQSAGVAHPARRFGVGRLAGIRLGCLPGDSAEQSGGTGRCSRNLPADEALLNIPGCFFRVGRYALRIHCIAE